MRQKVEQIFNFQKQFDFSNKQMGLFLGLASQTFAQKKVEFKKGNSEVLNLINFDTFNTEIKKFCKSVNSFKIK